jgi:hypothetical protein
LDKLLQFLAPIAFGLCKPILAVYEEVSISTLTRAFARHHLSYSLLANVDSFLLLKEPPGMEQLTTGAADSMEDFLRRSISTWPSGNSNSSSSISSNSNSSSNNSNSSWPTCDLVALSLYLSISAFLGTCQCHLPFNH